MKYRKRELFDAVQWFKLGDHPDVKLLQNYPYKECRLCKENIKNHGWLGCDSALVCPGDWIVTNEEGVGCVCNTDKFNSIYEPIEESATPSSITEQPSMKIWTHFSIDSSKNPDGTQNVFVGDRMYYNVDENGDQPEKEDDSWELEV